MGRQTTWVLALLVTCAPAAGSGARLDRAAGAPARRRRTAPRTPKTNKDKPPTPGEAGRPRALEVVALRPRRARHHRPAVAVNQCDFRVDHPEAAGDAAGTGSGRRGTLPHDQGAQGGHRRRSAGSSIALESARSQHNKTRVLMLYRMHLLLSAEQRDQARSAAGAARTRRRDQDRRHRSQDVDCRS